MLACFQDFCTIKRNTMEGEISNKPEPLPQQTSLKHRATQPMEQTTNPAAYWRTKLSAAPTPPSPTLQSKIVIHKDSNPNFPSATISMNQSKNQKP